MFFPTTSVDVYRDAPDNPDDEFGMEPSTAGIPILTNIPASIVLEREVRNTPSNLRTDAIRWYWVRVAAKYGLRVGDQVRDRRSNDRYQVESLGEANGLAGIPSGRLVCTRVRP